MLSASVSLKAGCPDCWASPDSTASRISRSNWSSGTSWARAKNSNDSCGPNCAAATAQAIAVQHRPRLRHRAEQVGNHRPTIRSGRRVCHGPSEWSNHTLL